MDLNKTENFTFAAYLPSFWRKHFTAFIFFLLLFLPVACRQITEDPISYGGPLPNDALRRLGKGSIGSLAYSPDGEQIIVGGDVGLFAYDVDTLEELWSLPTISPFNALSFAPNMKLLAAGSQNGTLSLIDTENGRILNALGTNSEDENAIISLAWAALKGESDEYILATGFNDGNVILSGLSGVNPEDDFANFSARVDSAFERHPGGVTALSFSPDSRFLLTGDRTGRMHIWEVETADKIVTLEGHEKSHAILSVDWSPDGAYLLSGGRDGTVILWDISVLSPLRIINEQSDEAIDVEFSPEGDTFVSTSRDGHIKMWPVGESEGNPSINLNKERISRIAWSQDLKSYVTSSPEGKLEMRQIDKNDRNNLPLKTLNSFVEPNQVVSDAIWSPDGEVLASIRGKDVIVWNAEEAITESVLVGHSSSVDSLAWSPDSRRLVSGDIGGKVIIWDVNREDKLLELDGHDRAVTDLAWSPDGNRIASAGGIDNIVILWDGENGEVEHVLSGGLGSGLYDVAWSPDGTLLATGSGLGPIYLWDIQNAKTDEPIDSLTRHLNWVTDLSWSPDGKRLASSSADNLVVVWDLDADSSKVYPGHSAVVRGIAFNPDGTKLASASHDGTVVVWDVGPEADRLPLAIFTGHADGVNSVDWSLDGSILASGSVDGTVILWNSDFQESEPE